MSSKDLENTNSLTIEEKFEKFNIEIEKRENEEPKFKVIEDPLHNEIQDIFKNKSLVNIFGNGPSLQKIEENSNHINFCINKALEVQKNCDILFFGDVYILFYLTSVDKNIMKNIKIIMIQSPLHNFKGKQDKKYGIDFIIKFLKCTAFEGIILPFNKLPIQKYNKEIGINIYFPQSGMCSVFALEILKLIDRELNYYGVSVPSMSEDKIVGYHEDVKKQYDEESIKHTYSRKHIGKILMQNTNLIRVLDYLKIKYKFN